MSVPPINKTNDSFPSSGNNSNISSTLLRYSKMCPLGVPHVNHQFAVLRDRPDSPRARLFAREIYDTIVIEALIRNQKNNNFTPIRKSPLRPAKAISILPPRTVQPNKTDAKRASAGRSPAAPTDQPGNTPPIHAITPIALPRTSDARDMNVWPLVGITSNRAELAKRIADVERSIHAAKKNLEEYRIATWLKQTEGAPPPPLPPPPTPDELARIMHELDMPSDVYEVTRLIPRHSKRAKTYPVMRKK